MIGNALALDLATKVGFATRHGKRLVIGTKDFSLKKDESAGLMFVRFRNWLTTTHKDLPFSIVYFEQVVGLSDRPGQGRQNQIYGGFKAVLLEWCENNGIAYSGVGVSEIKKHATGKGNAKKELMIAAAKEFLLDEGSVLILSKKPNPTLDDLDDNAADAYHVLRFIESEDFQP